MIMIHFHPRPCLDLSDIASDSASFDEKHNLLHDFSQVLVEPLRAEHLDYVFESTQAAFRNDPIREYILAGDNFPVNYSTRKRVWKIRCKRGLKTKTKFGFVVNGGDSNIIVAPPESDIPKPMPIDRAIGLILDIFEKGYILLFSSEQRKRLQENRTKMKQIFEEKLGNKGKEMFYVESLSTNPEKQGHGYASALVDTVSALANNRRRSIYLFAIADNIPFYEQFGYKCIGYISLGDGNPKWEKPPVIVGLLVRWLA